MTMLALLKTLPAVLAIQAGVSEPLDTDTIAELDVLVLGMCANGNNDTNTLSFVYQVSLLH